MIHHLPHGCIQSAQLRALAVRIDQLYAIHMKLGGGIRDRPCLNRIEVDHELERVVAYVRITDKQTIALSWDAHLQIWRETGHLNEQDE